MKFKYGDICVIKKADCGGLFYEHTLTISLNLGKVVRIELVEYPESEKEAFPYLVKSLDGSDFEYYSGDRYDDLWLPEEALEISNKYTLYDDVDCDGGVLV